MITYKTLENVSNETLYKSFMQAFEGFRITTEATYETFCEMLEEHNFDPKISVGAFDSETGKIISFILNGILKNNGKTAYDILTGTLADYRRQGIGNNVFVKIKEILKKMQIELYTTEVLKSNSAALNFYLSVGFEIKGEAVHVIRIPDGCREVNEYEMTMNL